MPLQQFRMRLFIQQDMYTCTHMGQFRRRIFTVTGNQVNTQERGTITRRLSLLGAFGCYVWALGCSRAEVITVVSTWGRVRVPAPELSACVCAGGLMLGATATVGVSGLDRTRSCIAFWRHLHSGPAALLQCRGYSSSGGVPPSAPQGCRLRSVSGRSTAERGLALFLRLRLRLLQTAAFLCCCGESTGTG